MQEKHAYDSVLWAAMAELTPSTLDVLFKPKDGLRKMAARTNRNITSWYRNQWSETANIVAVDFFHSTDIVDVALKANLKRAKCTSRATDSPSQSNQVFRLSSLSWVLSID